MKSAFWLFLVLLPFAADLIGVEPVHGLGEVRDVVFHYGVVPAQLVLAHPDTLFDAAKASASRKRR